MVYDDRDDYLKDPRKQLADKDVYMDVPKDPSALVSTIFESLARLRKSGNFSQITFNYFLGKDPKFSRFYVLPMIHKRLFYISGRPFSNCGFYTGNISQSWTLIYNLFSCS